MPIEIKELHIKAVVSNTTNQKREKFPDLNLSKLKKEVVQQCVQEVLEKLKEKTER